MEVLFLNKLYIYIFYFVRSNEGRWIGSPNLSRYPLLCGNRLPFDFFVCLVSHKTIIKGNSQLDKLASPSQHESGTARPSQHATSPAHTHTNCHRMLNHGEDKLFGRDLRSC